jgi:hypothetical protein
VAIAAAGLMAGSMGALSATEKHMEYMGSASALGSFGNIVSDIVRSNNTFDTAFEMSVPPGCDLLVTDKHDDYRSLSIYSNSAQLAFFPMGSVSMASPFRSVTFEGGAIITNETGLVTAERGPAVHTTTLPSGKKALYISITSISSDSFVSHAGPITLFVKCASVKPMSWHVPDGATVIIRARSGDTQVWKEAFEECELNVEYVNGAVRASGSNISDIYVVYAEAEVDA